MTRRDVGLAAVAVEPDPANSCNECERSLGRTGVPPQSERMAPDQRHLIAVMPRAHKVRKEHGESQGLSGGNMVRT